MNLYLLPRYNPGGRPEQSGAAAGCCPALPDFIPFRVLQHSTGKAAGSDCRTAPPIRGRGAGVMCGPARGELRQRPGAAEEAVRTSLPGSV